MDDLYNNYECDNMDENEFFQNEKNNAQFLSNHAPSFFPIEDDTPDEVIPTTDSSEQALFIENETSNDNPLVHGHVILNQACTLLSRHNKEIRPYKNQKNLFNVLLRLIQDHQYLFYIQKLCFFIKVLDFGCTILFICWCSSCRLIMSCSFLF